MYIYMYIIHSKRRELNKVILRAVSYIVLLRCRLIYNQHYAPYEHIYICIYTHLYLSEDDRSFFKAAYVKPWATDNKRLHITDKYIHVTVICVHKLLKSQIM